jgi:membrane protein implicated in regulation of membrane protease activity
LLLVLALIAAIFWVPSPWGVLLVVGAAVFELAEIWFWIWWGRRNKSVVGVDALVGAVAVASGRLDPDGHVRVSGELWQARSEAPAEAGERVVIEAVEPDLTLRVRPENGQLPE